MFSFGQLRYLLVASLVALVAIACHVTQPFVSGNWTAERSPLSFAVDRTESPQSSSIPSDLENEWTPELEREFQERANQTIEFYADQEYGNTFQENEKQSYAIAMLDFLAGHEQESLAFLQQEDAQASDHEHTKGIDYYFAFTLKGQIRKYFWFGRWLDPAYRQRMFEGAKIWTEEDPVERPHPIYGRGNGTGEDWSIQRRGYWVDRRNTDNLRAMRETSVYLMAEETGNETTRLLYKQKLQRYVWALYNIGMGEWDSENYHAHTFAPYLNLYDFAQDPEVKQLAKAALDWLSAAAAVKYYHGAWGAPIKRDAGSASVVFGSGAARFFWLYFGDAIAPNPEPEKDAIHAITSSYRPPLAVVALARKQFDRPLELLSSKPSYENWLPGGEDAPAYWETSFWGQTYHMGSVVSGFADGDVAPFKLMADNSQRGVDFFVANTGDRWASPGKKSGDQIGQFQNLLIWLTSQTDRPFLFQLPKTATIESEDNLWFVQLEKTWLALHPIRLNQYESIEPSERIAERYPDEQGLKAIPENARYAGFALEVGEVATQGSYAEFKQRVKRQSRLEFDEQAGSVQLTSSQGKTLKLIHNAENELPIVIRDGVQFDRAAHFDLYRPATGDRPIQLGWKRAILQVKAGDYHQTFRLTVNRP